MAETECRSKQHLKNLNCIFFWFLLIYSCFDKGSPTKRIRDNADWFYT